MEFEGYNEKIKEWTQGVLDNYRKDAELTIEYCDDLIAYGKRTGDARILGFAYHHLSGTLYCLNDGENIFDITVKAIENLEKSSQWGLLARSYNILGIVTFSRGNLPVAYDYYLDGLMYCDKYNLVAERGIIYINCGVLNIEAGRYNEALSFFKRALEVMKADKEQKEYHTQVITATENIVTCKVLMNDFAGIDELFENLEQEHMPYADAIDRMAFMLSKTFYLHRRGQFEKRDEYIKEIDERLTPDIVFMDLMDDFFVYANVLCDCDKEEEFWNLLDILEPMINGMKVTSMKMKLLSIKIKFYRKHSMNAEFLQAAGLYYEFSERRERESKEMMSEVIGLRNSFEKVNLAKKKMEKENQILAEQSETDDLTGMANRRKLNVEADEIFKKALEKRHSFAIEILDVDYFKEYNDNYGHQAGDKCLIKIADCIKQVAGEHGGFCARYGGDEFIIIYDETSREEAECYAQQLKNKVMECDIEHRYSKAMPIVTISQGIFCDVPVAENKVWDFLHIADDMLYSIKKQCRNSYCIADVSQYLGKMEA